MSSSMGEPCPPAVRCYSSLLLQIATNAGTRTASASTSTVAALRTSPLAAAFMRALVWHSRGWKGAWHSKRCSSASPIGPSISTTRYCPAPRQSVAGRPFPRRFHDPLAVTHLAKVTYIEFGGGERVLDVQPGLSVREGATANNVTGILGECGGNCLCATCHVYVDPAWVDKLPAKDDAEVSLLECVVNPQPNSRLSCQINVT